MRVLGSLFLLIFIVNIYPAPNLTICNKSAVNNMEDSLKIIRDIRYASQPDSLNGDTSSDKLLDLYIPAKNGNKTLPVLIFVHGGGFRGGDKLGKSILCSKLAMKGFAVVAINYWLTLKHHSISGSSCTANMSKGIPPDSAFHPALRKAVQNASNDLVLTLKWLKMNARKYNLDPSKVALSGGSAGAMTVLYAVYISGQKVLPVKAVVDMWGGLENTNLVKKGAPPVLIYHGDKDRTINVDFAYALKERMNKIGDTESVLHILKGKGHARYDIIRKDKVGEIADFLIKTMKIK